MSVINEAELREKIRGIDYTFIDISTGKAFEVNGFLSDGSLDSLLDLYRENERTARIEVKEIYMRQDYEGTDDDMIQEIIKVTEKGLSQLSNTHKTGEES